MQPVLNRLALDPRIPALRQRCLERKTLIPPWDGDPRLMLQSLQSSQELNSWTLRRGLLTRDLLVGMQFAVDDLELLLGRLAPDTEQWQLERSSTREILAKDYPHLFTPGQSGHCQLDLTYLFERGIDGVRTNLELRRDASIGHQAELYQSFIDALSGLSQMIENAARTANDVKSSFSSTRRIELDEIAANCWRIAHFPPADFREALQLTWLVILGVQFADRAALVVPGHLDRILGDYYQRDIETGRLTPEFALMLIENLYLLINEYVPDGLAVSVMVGGRAADGSDLTNPLSYLCLEALRRTHLVYPTVGVCWHIGTPQSLCDLAVELMALGNPNPAFFGDETIQRGLRSYGVPADESWNYINSTCVEITPVGASNTWVASPYFSTNQVLLDEIKHQINSGLTSPDFESFLENYRTRLSAQVASAVAVENQNRLQRQKYGGKPLQSVFTRDCIARGHDIDDGGARYNWVECSFVGFANLADSLYVLNQEVYVQKHLTLAELFQILQADFVGYEREHQRFMHNYPKYGNDLPEVDRLVGEMVQFVRQECARHSMIPDNSPYVPGAFCWIMHERLGRECGATPDGRRAGFPFADGCGPAQGRELKGPTAAVLSTTTWDASALVGGAAFNMKFNSSLFNTPGTIDRLRDLILTFLQRGGFETQVNVVDGHILRQAQAHPDEYRDLVVRIGGYTDYFTHLSPEMQAEVILRTEYQGV
jgi:pyruvate-formate lyase